MRIGNRRRFDGGKKKSKLGLKGGMEGEESRRESGGGEGVGGGEVL